jgi:hypothetical protein
MIQTATQYAQAVATLDQDRINAMIDRIPSNINRAGAHYKKLTKQIRYEHHQKQSRHPLNRCSSVVATVA